MENAGTLSFKSGIMYAYNHIQEMISMGSDIRYIEANIDEAMGNLYKQLSVLA
jgi:hypothetical protein